MLAAVNLDRNPMIETSKINDIAADRRLPSDMTAKARATTAGRTQSLTS
jgi:hypothetical protein